MKVEGPDNKAIYSGKQSETAYQPATATAPTAPATKPTAGNLQAQMAIGSKLYTTHCLGCHQPEGRGLPGIFPPLAKSDYLMADTSRTIETVLNGYSGALEVNGQSYHSVMPPMGHLKDEDIAHVLTYVMNWWGNEGGPVSAADVAVVRAKTSR